MADGIRVLKFGGSSVGDPAVMRRAAMVVTAALSRDGRPGSGPGVVVVSALGGVTRQLVQISEAAVHGDPPEVRRQVSALRARHSDFLTQLDLGSEDTQAMQAAIDERFEQLQFLLCSVEPDAPVRLSKVREFEDRVLAFGELLASHLFWGVLRSLGVRCIWMDARDFLRTDSTFRAAKPDLARTQALTLELVQPQLEAGYSVVVPGFVGSTMDGRPTTMGFEASDLTATVLASALDAREVQIWTDVSGVMSADPRVVAEVRPIVHISYESAGEMALLGARVLHPDTMSPVQRAGIGVRVVNCSRPGEPGSLIDDDKVPNAEDVVVTSRSGQAVLRVRVASAGAQAALTTVRRMASNWGVTDLLFAIQPYASGDKEIVIVTRSEADHSRLEPFGRLHGTTSVEMGMSTVSIVSAGAMRPSWPGTWKNVLEWEGLTRSRGIIVGDADCDATVRTIHHQCVARLQAAGEASS